MVAVGEDLVLERQERAARVDEVDAGQLVLLGDLLRAQVLLDREREVRAALDRRVVGDDHALLALDDADPGDDSGRRGLALVHVPGGQGAELEEGASRVEQAVDSLPRGQLAARAVALDRLVAAARGDLRRALAQLGDERLHALAPLPRRPPIRARPASVSTLMARERTGRRAVGLPCNSDELDKRLSITQSEQQGDYADPGAPRCP